MNPASCTLRTFNFPKDYPVVVDLWRQAGPGIHLGRSDTLEEIAKKVQRDPDLFILAEQDGHLVGAVMGGYDGRRGLMYHLAVNPAYRKQGIGLALAMELEKRLQAKGCIKCYLLVVPGNEDAIQFYHKNGWEEMPLIIFGKEFPN